MSTTCIFNTANPGNANNGDPDLGSPINVMAEAPDKETEERLVLLTPIVYLLEMC
jgi:hypothetical protein